MEFCEELFLNEVCRVELVLVADCDLTVPANADEQVTMAGLKMSGTEKVDRIGTPKLAVDAVYSSDNDIELESAPTLKTTHATQRAGFLMKHELIVPTRGNYESIRQSGLALKGYDFNVILKTMAGTRFLLYALPNTSVVAVEDQFGGESKQTVKVSLQSMSHMIRLIEDTKK